MTLKQNISDISNDPKKLKVVKITLAVSILFVLAISFFIGKFTYNVSPFSYYAMNNEEKSITKEIYGLEKEYERIEKEKIETLSKYYDAKGKESSAGQRKISEAALNNFYGAALEAQSLHQEYERLGFQLWDIRDRLNILKSSLGK